MYHDCGTFSGELGLYKLRVGRGNGFTISCVLYTTMVFFINGQGTFTSHLLHGLFVIRYFRGQSGLSSIYFICGLLRGVTPHVYIFIPGHFLLKGKFSGLRSF